MVEIKIRKIAPNPTAEDIGEFYEEAFPAVARFVAKLGGTFEDARDIFHDALILLLEKEWIGERPVLDRKAYLLGIAKHLWIRKFKLERWKVGLDDAEDLISVPEDFYPKPSLTRLMYLLERTGKACLALLQAFYYDHRSVTEIAKAMGYSSPHSAAVQKNKCLEKVRDKIKENAYVYDTFLD